MPAPAVVVVAPTYNERGNIREFTRRVFASGAANLHLIVVDDNSPDGTGAVLDELAGEYALQVIHRPHRQGLGAAYREGFTAALRLKPDYVIQLDADLSHDPALLPVFLQAAESNDLVLGSRYVDGGEIRQWGFLRRRLSRLANQYARLILRLPQHDVTSGYKCWRSSLLEQVLQGHITSVGYVFIVETTYRAAQAGSRIAEIPIVFTERRAGQSKLQLATLLESLIKILALRLSTRHSRG